MDTTETNLTSPSELPALVLVLCLVVVITNRQRLFVLHNRVTLVCSVARYVPALAAHSFTVLKIMCTRYIHHIKSPPPQRPLLPHHPHDRLDLAPRVQQAPTHRRPKPVKKPYTPHPYPKRNA